MSYCTPCPPCDSEFPLLCEPLETTANGKRLVVEDSAACQKTIQTPTSKQVLNSSNGNVEFATLNSVLQSGPVDLGSQPLTTTGTATVGSIISSGNIAINSSGDITTLGSITSKNLKTTGTGTENFITFINTSNTVGMQGMQLAFDNDRMTFQRVSDSGVFEANYVSINQDDGKVGIGTTSPNANLTVLSSGNINGSAAFVGTSETSFFNNSIDEHTYIRGGKTTSNVYLNDTSTGSTFVGSGGLVVNGTIFATGNSSKIGYTSGGSVTQGAGAKTNSVTLNRPTGIIITDNASLANNTAVAFTLNNSVIESTDIVLVSHISGGTLGSYSFTAAPATGNAAIVIRNITPAGSLSEALTLRFIVIKSVNA